MTDNRFRLAALMVLATSACDDEKTLTAPSRPESPSLAAGAPFDRAAMAPNTWATKRPKPTPGSLMQAGTIGSIIYVVGGLANSSSPSRVVEAYNVAHNTWSTRRQLPSARYAANGATPLAGQLYVTGGFDGSFALAKTFYAYNPATNTWVKKADLPVAGACGAQALIDGQFYVYTSCTSVFNGHRLWRYNAATGRWVTLRSPSTVHQGPAAGVIGGKLYLAGGSTGSGQDNLTLEVYNPATNTWVTRAPPPALLNGTASGVLNKKLYAAGGVDGEGFPIAALRMYNPTANTWTIKAPMPSARWRPAGAVASGLLFVIAGVAENAGTVEAYTP